MKILLSNDDGYLNPGLVRLFHALSSLARVTVIAPERNRSGISSAMTFDRPLRVTRAENGFLYVDGTPADCVHLAITGFLREEWDVVISGINTGRNLGDDVLYSGTVGAAMEARFLGIPVMAISLAAEKPVHLETAIRATEVLLDHIRENPRGGLLSGSMVLNVNVPDVEWREVEGFEVTRLGERNKPLGAVSALDAHGHTVYRIGEAGPARDADPGTDFHAILNNRVSITPLQVDRTNHTALEATKDWAGPLDTSRSIRHWQNKDWLGD